MTRLTVLITADCCPSGRATVTWSRNGRSFHPGRTTVR